MRIEMQLKDQKNPLEYTLIKDVEKVEYKYNYVNKEHMVYFYTDASFITVPINEIDKMEIQKG